MYSDRLNNENQYEPYKKKFVFGAMLSATNKHGVWVGFKMTNGFTGLSVGYAIQ